MSKSFTNTDHYPADVDAMWAMVTDRAYWEAKYQTLGASNVVWNSFDVTDDAFTISTVREVAANLPSVAKKVIGETAVVTQTERWRRGGGRCDCDITIETKGAPGGTSGTMAIVPSGDGSDWSADFTIKVSVPLVGGKLEGIMRDETATNFAAEKTFNDQWLAKH
jgi:hypothetical protein